MNHLTPPKKLAGIDTKIVLVALFVLFALNVATPAFAYDQPWNGNREDITGTDDEDDDDCEGNECDCPNENNTGSPVYTARGYLVWKDTDIAFPTETRVGLARTYNSFDYKAGLFGRGWVTAQEVNIARTYRAVTEGNTDGSPKTATEFESVPIWLSSYGRRYTLQETTTECTTPNVLYFTFQKQEDGTFKQVFEDSQSFSIYSENGVLLQEYSDKDGTTVYYEYDDQSRLIRQFDSYGFTLNFIYNEQGFVSQVTDQADRAWYYTYDEFGRLTQVLNPDGNTKDYGYQRVDNIGYSQHLLTSVSDNVDDPVLSVSWANITLYDKKAMRVTSYTGIDGHRHDYTYAQTTFQGTPSVRVIKDTKQVGSNTTIERQTFIADAGNYRILSAVNNTDNLTVTRSFDSRGNVLEENDERGNITRYEYNGQGRRTTVTELADTNEAKVTTYTYWENTDRIAVMNEYGIRETRYTYDDDLRILMQTQVDLANNEQRVTTYTYHPNIGDSQNNTRLGKIASINGPQPGVQDTTFYEYNGQGLITKITYPLDHEVIYSYNTAGQQIGETDINGIVTEMAYNSRNQLIDITRNNRTATYAYSGQDQLISTTDELGRITLFKYDDYNQLSQIIYPSGDNLRFNYTYSTTYTEVRHQYYQADGTLINQQISRNDAQSTLPIQEYLATTSLQVSEEQYNSFNELTRRTRFGQYNGSTGSTVERYAYDREGRLTRVQDPASGYTQFIYDPLDRVTQLTDANNGQTQYTYSAWGELLQTISPDTGTTVYKVDTSGNTTSQTNANNQQIQYRYDAQNRLTAIDYEGDELDVVMIYDEGTLGTGLLTSVRDGSGSSQYQYDDRQLITQANVIVADVNFTTNYEYNNTEELTSITYPSGVQVAMAYDNAGRLSSIILDQNGTETSILNTITWHGPSIKSHQQGNDLVTEFFYDDAGRLIEKRFGGEDRRFQNQLDNQGQITQQIWTRNGTQDANAFQYNNLGQLIRDGSTDDNLDWLFGYDRVGNRLNQRKSDNSENINYDYETNSNRLSQIGATAIQRDVAGNTLDDGIRQYQYNVMNRLSQLTNTQNGIQTSYTYNHKAQRVRKQLSGVTVTDVRYVYGLNDELLGEYDSSGNRVREYIYRTDADQVELIAQIESDGTIIYIHTDHLGTPYQVTDQNRNIVWQRIFDAFGIGNVDEDPDNDGNITAINIRFPGQYYDSESGLHYNWNRYYDPSTGRYITSDPIGLEAGVNTYLYAQANPLIYSDPSGLIVPLLVRAGIVIGKWYLKLPCMLYELIDCKGKVVYVGISKAPVARMYGHRSSRGVIGKFGCDDNCPVKMRIRSGYKKRSQCLRAEKRRIRSKKPIWNTQHNPDPSKGKKRDAWRKKNCECQK